MSYKKTMEGVKRLAMKELEMASEEFGEKFHSNHEAFAVIKEESDEHDAETKFIQHFLAYLWDDVKNDAPIDQELLDLEHHAIRAACEAIQIAAMARKAMR